MTSITILGGSGQQGRGLAQRLAQAGLNVLVGSRDPDRARAAVAGWPRPDLPIEVADNASSVDGADLIVLAVPFPSVDELLRELQPHFKDGALVIDVTVPVTFASGKMAMIEVAEGSASEHVRARLPAAVRLAAAFKTLPAHLLGATGDPLDCDEFVCGDSEGARSEAAVLVNLLPGVRAIDAGPLSRARSIEHLTALSIAINRLHNVYDAGFLVVGL